MAATLPTVKVEIGTSVGTTNFVLDDATLGKLDTGGTLGDVLGYELSDITDSVRLQSGIVINRGGTRNRGPYFRAETGMCSFALDNRDGDFDPLNLSGTWVSAGVSQLRPGLVVVVSAVLGGASITLFVGKVESWKVTYPGRAIDSVAEVTVVDAIAEFAAANKLASPVQGDNDNAGERIDRVLDNIGWPSQWRNLDTDGAEEFISTELAQPAWTEMLLAADSANGYLFVNRDGWVTYATKSRFPRTAGMWFADGGVPVDSLEVSTDADQVYNTVKLGRAGGTVQGVTDETSAALYGTRTYSRTDLIVDTDYLVAESAGHILSQYRNLQRRVENIHVTCAQDTEQADWSDLLELDMLRRVSSTFETTDGRSVTIDGLVRGLRMDIRPFTWRWSISTTQAPDAFGTFTLDDIALGVLDTGTLAAF